MFWLLTPGFLPLDFWGGLRVLGSSYGFWVLGRSDLGVALRSFCALIQVWPG